MALAWPCMHAAGTEDTQTLLAQLFGKLVAAGRAAVGKGKKQKTGDKQLHDGHCDVLVACRANAGGLVQRIGNFCFGFRR
jgi:hypothetical protein